MVFCSSALLDATSLENLGERSPIAMLKYIAAQLRVDPKVFDLYTHRKATWLGIGEC